MRLLVITQTRGRSGRALQSKREVKSDWIRIGRAASSEIHLPDPRVDLNHALIIDRDGPVFTQGEGGIVGRLSTTRKAVVSVRLKAGVAVLVGPYRFSAIEAPEGYDGAIVVELLRPVEDLPDTLARRSTRLTLASLRLPKRWGSWALFALVGTSFLVIPAGRVLDLPWRQASERLTVAGDRAWNPGPVLLAHQPIGQKCGACHEVAFEHVKDRACLECHVGTGHHVGPELRPVAHFESARCASCHRDHKGTKPTHRDDDEFCVACHRDLRARVGSTTALGAADFAKDHPAFRLSLPDERGVRRVRQGSGPIVEASNLAFPHAVHLDPKGIRSPVQGRMKLECVACHQPDASRRTFEPIRMAKHCQECHRLEFEPAVTTREVPHGAPRNAQVVIEEFYANLALNAVADSFVKAFGVPGEGLLRRVGEPTDTERRGALGLAERKARKVAAELFEVRVCKTCHTVTRSGTEAAADFEVAAVRANHRWMPQARFDHKSHAQTKCLECHDVARSRKSSDVAMPTIETCRECHGGRRPQERKVTSNCLLCHGFHDARYVWDPTFRPKSPTRVAHDAR